MNCDMLNYKSTQNGQPIYDYYIETDLDSVDDQPVDYSKKYTDQDSYEHCQSIKSPLKSDEFPNEGPRTIKQSSSDEVKVYCIEGTPLTISSASSFSDLREIGTSDEVEKCKRNRLSSSANDGENIGTFEIINKNCAESPDIQIGVTSPSKEKDDIKEGKIVSFRSSNEISKASTPLMFSRSSSIASLNSFEQHSFVDDRSSVSAFSALTSGLISPSDLPDSPGDIMSPALTDKDSSPKIDVTKIDFNSECDDRFTEKDEIGPEKHLDNVTDNPISIHTRLPQTNEYIPVNLFEPGSKNSEENEDLIERLDISNDSLDVDEVFDDTELNKKPHLQSREDSCKNSTKSDDESDGEDNILLQECIKLGMPSDLKEKEPAINRRLEDFQLPSQNASIPQVERKKENIVVLLDSDGKEENIFVNRKIVSVKIINANVEKEKLEIDDGIISDDDSDQELLQNCIQSGMPVDKSKKVEANVKQFESQYSSLSTNYKSEKNIGSPTIKSDDDSDGDEDLIQQAILRGLPTQSSEKKMPQPCKRMEYRDNLGSPIIKSDDDSDGDDDLIQQAILRGLPTKSSEKKVSQQSCKTIEYHDVPVKTNILPHTVQMRMPKESDKRLSLNTEELIKSKYNPHRMSNSPMNVNNKVYPMKKILNPDENGTYLLNDTHYNKMQMHGESGNKKRLDLAVSTNCGYNNYYSDVYYPTNANCRMGPVKKVPNTHENPYFSTSMKMQMPREPVGKERLPSGVSMMPEYNPHPANCCCVNNDAQREMMKQLERNKKRWNSGMISEYNNSHPVNSRPMNMRHDYGIQMEMPRESDKKKRLDTRVPMNSGYNPHPVTYSSLNELRDRYPDGTSDGDEDCKLLENCIKSGMPSPKSTSDFQKRPSPQTRTLHVPRKQHTPRRPCAQEASTELNKKKNHSRLPQNQPTAPVYSNTTWISSTSYIDVDSMRIYRTEDTPVLSPTASISDLSSLSFNESFLNNSRNSDFSSESEEDDELLRDVIRLGMPEAKRAVA